LRRYYTESCLETAPEPMIVLREGAEADAREEETKTELNKIFPWWHGKTHSEHVRSTFPDEVSKAWKTTAIDSYWLLQGGGSSRH
jgi:hypothetical protein